MLRRELHVLISIIISIGGISTGISFSAAIIATISFNITIIIVIITSAVIITLMSIIQKLRRAKTLYKPLNPKP